MQKEHLSTGNARRRQGKAALQQANLDSLTLTELHHYLGNRRVGRLLARRGGAGAFELDEETAERINRERSGGQPLEEGVLAPVEQALGVDLGAVRIHTSSEADALSRQIGAQAFTTGRDIFFRQGAYAPHTTQGRELIAHELTHVLQQSTGSTDTGTRMIVGAPDDVFEQEAEATAHALVQPRPAEEELDTGESTSGGGVEALAGL